VNQILNATAEDDLCVAADVAAGSTYKACFRALIAMVTRLRSEAQQPVGVNVKWDYSDRVQKVLSDHIWLGTGLSKEDLEFLVGTCVILPRTCYTEVEIQNAPRAVDAAAVIRKLMAD